MSIKVILVTSTKGKEEYQSFEEVMYGWPLICSNPLFLAEVTAAMSPSVGGRRSDRRVEPDQNVVQ